MLEKQNIDYDRFVEKLNHLGAKRCPFFFLTDFEMVKPIVFPIKDISHNWLLFDLNGKSNASAIRKPQTLKYLNKFPISLETYSKAFNIIEAAINKGNTYLANLTCRTKIQTNLDLHDLFFLSRAKYKIWYNNEFLCFSPETFITIRDGKITSRPMKGTIDASIPDAENRILNDIKEKAEHNTIIDLIRNDLSQIATNVVVENYRYIETIHSNNIELLQISSAITGKINGDFHKNIGEIIYKLLPAGSISGAPKYSTINIIKEAEKMPRGFYTGICGIFDGINLDCGVMIRFIENENGVYYFRSGGGITAMSSMEEEYNEMINKIYVPVN